MAKSGANDVSTSALSSSYLRHRTSRIIAVVVVIATLVASSSDAAAIAAAAAAGNTIQLPVGNTNNVTASRDSLSSGDVISVPDIPVDGVKAEKPLSSPAKLWKAEPGNSMTSSQRDEEETVDLANQEKLALIEKSLQESEELANEFNLPPRFDYKGWSDDDVEFNEPDGEWSTQLGGLRVKRHTPDDVTAMTAENMNSAVWSRGKAQRIKRDLADNEIDENGDVDREMEKQDWTDYVTNRRPIYEGERNQDGAQLVDDAADEDIEQPSRQRPTSSLELMDGDGGQQEEGDEEQEEMERQREEEKDELDEEDYRQAVRLLGRKEAQDAILEYIDDLERQRERLQQQEGKDERLNSASSSDVDEQPTALQVIPVMYHGVRGVFVPETSVAHKRSYKPSPAAADAAAVAQDEDGGRRPLPLSFSVDEVRTAADRWSTLVREEVKKALDEYDLVYRLADALKDGERSNELRE